MSEAHPFEGVTSEELFQEFMRRFGVDPSDEHFEGTPERVVRMYKEILAAQNQERPDFKFTVFDAPKTSNLIVQDNINFHSVCSHHLIPFFGVAHVAYLPDKKLCGLSKLTRTVKWFCQRLQVQEILSDQIADFLEEELKPKGVAVIMRGRHLCMEMRGIKEPCAHTTTSALRGLFLEESRLKDEFFQVLQLRGKDA